jgi:hypothetical protein
MLNWDIQTNSEGDVFIEELSPPFLWCSLSSGTLLFCIRRCLVRRRARQGYHGGQGQDVRVQLFAVVLRATILAGRGLDSPRSLALSRPHPNHSRSCAHRWSLTILGVEVLFLGHDCSPSPWTSSCIIRVTQTLRADLAFS